MMNCLKKNKREILVTVEVFDHTGHTITQNVKVATMEKQLMKPDRAILVDGQTAESWDEVLKLCKQSKETQPLVSSVPRIVGG